MRLALSITAVSYFFAAAAVWAQPTTPPAPGEIYVQVHACIDDDNWLKINGSSAVWYYSGKGTQVGVAVPGHGDCRATPTLTVIQEWQGGALGWVESDWSPTYPAPVYTPGYSDLFSNLKVAIPNQSVLVSTISQQGRNNIGLTQGADGTICVKYTDPQLNADWYTIVFDVKTQDKTAAPPTYDPDCQVGGELSSQAKRTK